MTNTKAKTQSLMSKLAQVSGELTYLQKKGHNTFHNYKYATEQDILEAVGEKLAAKNIVIIPTCSGESREQVGNKGEVVTSLKFVFIICDGETGETIEAPWQGWGSDKADKGGYKAMTGALKYFLLKLFLIPTGDEPEQDSKADEDTNSNEPCGINSVKAFSREGVNYSAIQNDSGAVFVTDNETFTATATNAMKDERKVKLNYETKTMHGKRVAWIVEIWPVAV